VIELANGKPELGSLEHYGVKGMHWGQTKAKKNPVPVIARPGFAIGQRVGLAIARRNTTPDTSGVTRRQARQQIKSQNRQTSRNLQDFDRSANRSNMIRKARGDRVTAQRRYEDLKSELKDQKSRGAIGKNAARVAMNRIKNERYENVFKANSHTVGEQFVKSLLEGVDQARGTYNAPLYRPERM
jgi:hypothetical protein